MILLTGGTGYIGSEFCRELDRRGLTYISPARHSYDNPTSLNDVLADLKPTLVLNAAAFIPHESVVLCDHNQAETIKANTLLPAMMSQCCHERGIPFAHISTGCLWSDGQEHVEYDPPQRAFNGHCGFYIGTKVLAEEAVMRNCENHYIWRIRLPFDELDSPRNYLSKLARFPEVFDHVNTLSHRGDFVRACLDLWQMRATFGTYHVMNTGSVSAKNICELLMQEEIRTDTPRFITGPQGGCIVSNQKLRDVGVRIRPIEEALLEAMDNWKPE